MPGQTQRQIRHLLEAAGLAPQHRLGQHFLVDLNLMRKLVAAADLSPLDTVLEVGAGTGSLTEILLSHGCRVVAVEVDHGLQALLRERLGGDAHFTLIQADALASKHRVNPLVLKVLTGLPPRAGRAYKLVANLPYQIATPLLVDLLLVSPRFDRLVCTIQKEVGQRLVAEPRAELYGPTSVVVQTLAHVTPHAIIPPQAFWPRPQVESVLLSIRPRAPESVEVQDVPGFVDFVRRAFQQRRKMLRRVLRHAGEPELLAACQRAGVTAEARPEDLGPSAWRRLFAALRPRSG